MAIMGVQKVFSQSPFQSYLKKHTEERLIITRFYTPKPGFLVSYRYESRLASTSYQKNIGGRKFNSLQSRSVSRLSLAG
jgi:hypothetical protein